MAIEYYETAEGERIYPDDPRFPGYGEIDFGEGTIQYYGPPPPEPEPTFEEQQRRLLGALREPLINQLTQIARGEYNFERSPTYEPAYSQARGGLEEQFGTGKENILKTMAEGGQKEKALTGLETSRAVGVGSLPSMISQGIYRDISNRAFGMMETMGAGVERQMMQQLMLESQRSMQEERLRAEEVEARRQAKTDLATAIAGML